jgi:hypothetical protein
MCALEKKKSKTQGTRQSVTDASGAHTIRIDDTWFAIDNPRNTHNVAQLTFSRCSTRKKKKKKKKKNKTKKVNKKRTKRRARLQAWKINAKHCGNVSL